MKNVHKNSLDGRISSIWPKTNICEVFHVHLHRLVICPNSGDILITSVVINHHSLYGGYHSCATNDWRIFCLNTRLHRVWNSQVVSFSCIRFRTKSRVSHSPVQICYHNDVIIGNKAEMSMTTFGQSENRWVSVKFILGMRWGCSYLAWDYYYQHVTIANSVQVVNWWMDGWICQRVYIIIVFVLYPL